MKTKRYKIRASGDDGKQEFWTNVFESQIEAVAEIERVGNRAAEVVCDGKIVHHSKEWWESAKRARPVIKFPVQEKAPAQQLNETVKRGWFARKFFPIEECDQPINDQDRFLGVIRIETKIRLTFYGRLRALVSGGCVIKTIVLTEHLPGETKASCVVSIAPF